MHAVLHCAGPFAHTARPMADACLRAGVHYLDITGEAAVFEALAARSAEAQGGGRDAAAGGRLRRRALRLPRGPPQAATPSATRLALGFRSLGRVSRGTATTMAENMHRGGLVRQGGVLTRVPAAWKTRVIDFGTGPVKAITIPWGDVSTAYHSTGIPNIEVYMAAPLGRAAGGAGESAPRLVAGLAAGPGAAPVEDSFRTARADRGGAARGRSYLWGEAVGPSGERVVSRLRGPEGYTLTARAALAVVERVLAGDAPPGFQTPSTAYGPTSSWAWRAWYVRTNKVFGQVSTDAASTHPRH